MGRNFVEVSHHLHLFRQDSVMAVQHRDEILDATVILYTAADGSDFVCLDDNGCPHRADIKAYLESERDCAYGESSILAQV